MDDDETRWSMQELVGLLRRRAEASGARRRHPSANRPQRSTSDGGPDTEPVADDDAEHDVEGGSGAS